MINDVLCMYAYRCVHVLVFLFILRNQAVCYDRKIAEDKDMCDKRQNLNQEHQLPKKERCHISLSRKNNVVKNQEIIPMLLSLKLIIN